MLRGKRFWLRSIGSSWIGEVFQSLITFSIAFLYSMPMKSFFMLVVSAGLFKLLYSVFMAVIGSRVVIILKRTETFKDPDLNFNPFKN